MPRERVEDLGMLAQRLAELCDHDLFEWKGNIRNKEAAEWFMNLSDDKKEDTIHMIAYNLEFLSDELHECYQIARWGDVDSE